MEMNLIRACIIVNNNRQTDAYKASDENIKLIEDEIKNKDNYNIEYGFAPYPIDKFNKNTYKFN